ncbi:MAG: NmrA family NAD(P)-binding protein [Anaerolineales bacterium]
MILISGAAGKTGQAVIKALNQRQQAMRAFVRTQQQKQSVEKLGAAEVVVGDLTQASDLAPAFDGVQKVLHICPNVHPEEVEIGAQMIKAAKRAGVEHFVFHSVMHPQIESMPHHWKKMRVEEMLIESGLPFTIVQPASYMQNLSLSAVRTTGVVRVPYSLQSRHSMVDLADIAEIYAVVLAEEGYQNGIYELAGPEALDYCQITEMLSQAFNRPVELVQESIPEWRQRAHSSGMTAYAIETWAKMFEHYDQHGFLGNPTTLEHLLQRPPTALAAFLERTIS